LKNVHSKTANITSQHQGKVKLRSEVKFKTTFNDILGFDLREVYKKSFGTKK